MKKKHKLKYENDVEKCELLYLSNFKDARLCFVKKFKH